LAAEFETWPLFLLQAATKLQSCRWPHIQAWQKYEVNLQVTRITSIKIPPSVYMVDFVGSWLHNSG